ncbi:hypothetical protein AB0G32_19630 [Streptomyces sp. NPDC023723]|uniref:hypothetical protein n=1 Tax=Streptomyces sp. NPDC023723 TaxID=3154323 RepID=UPI0034060A18
MRGIFSLVGAAPSNSNAQPWQVEVVSGAARQRLADALRTAHAERRTSVDYPYSEGMYAPVHQERRAAFGAELYGALGIGSGDHTARAVYDSESLRRRGCRQVRRRRRCPPGAASSRPRRRGGWCAGRCR